MNAIRFKLCLFVILLFAVGTSAICQDTRNRRAEQKQPDTQTLDIIRVDSNLVRVPVIVSDREGRYVPNLSVDHFKLFDNTSEQKITYFDAAEEPVSIAILLDTSLSTEGVVDDIRNAAKNFLKELRPQDRATIISFDFAVHRLSTLTNDRKVLERAIKNAKVGGYFGTTLNDAVIEVARNDFRTVTGRKAIILLSDGVDFGSVVETDALLNEESESDTMVYSIYYAPELRKLRDPKPFPGSFPEGLPLTRGEIFGRGRRGTFNHVQRPGQRGFRRNWINGAGFLRELSELTSGRFYQSERTDLKKTFSLIAEELRHQYSLGFYPGELQRDGSIHQLRVRVDVMDVAVRARQKYRAH